MTRAESATLVSTTYSGAKGGASWVGESCCLAPPACLCPRYFITAAPLCLHCALYLCSMDCVGFHQGLCWSSAVVANERPLQKGGSHLHALSAVIGTPGIGKSMLINYMIMKSLQEEPSVAVVWCVTQTPHTCHTSHITVTCLAGKRTSSPES